MKKYGFYLLLLMLATLGCFKKEASRQYVENKLKQAMQNYLYQSVNNDSSTVRYRVETVDFFEAPEFYECEFTVHVFSPVAHYDTTGFMTARISKDFVTVKRKL